MSNPRTPTYDDLSALCAQMAAALEKLDLDIFNDPQEIERAGQFRETIETALTAYRTLSPDPQWQRMQEGAASDVLAERRRQIEKEGWTPEHDDMHVDGELSLAAALYAIPYQNSLIEQNDFIGLHMALENGHGWNLKPDKDPRKRLVKAGALILAEIERLDRARGEG